MELLIFSNQSCSCGYVNSAERRRKLLFISHNKFPRVADDWVVVCFAGPLVEWGICPVVLSMHRIVRGVGPKYSDRALFLLESEQNTHFFHPLGARRFLGLFSRGLMRFTRWRTHSLGMVPVVAKSQKFSALGRVSSSTRWISLRVLSMRACPACFLDAGQCFLSILKR